MLSATFVTFLGFICDSIRQAFLLSEGKKLKFKMLRENILESKTMTMKTSQRFAGKAVSFSFAISGCRLHREIFKAISRVIQRWRLKSPVFSDLSWNIGDSWMTGQVACLGGRKNTSRSLYIATFLNELAEECCCRVVAELKHRIFVQDESGSINFLEAKDLFCALDAFKARIRDSRVDVHTDNKSLLGLWKNDGGSNSR